MKQKEIIHSFLEVSSYVAEVAQPLEALSITCFSYLKNFKNNVQINLSSQPQWIDDYYQFELYKSSQFEGSIKEYNQKISLWSSAYMDSAVIRHGRENFNSDHGITLIENNCDSVEFYFFSGATNNPYMHTTFINNLDYLNSFILYFKDKLGSKIKKLGGKNSLLNKTIVNPITTPTSNFNTEPAIKTHRLILNNENNIIRFSPRETECIRQLLQFKSTSQIAHGMSVTLRTAEWFIEQIKQKINVYSKQELLDKLIALRNYL